MEKNPAFLQAYGRRGKALRLEKGYSLRALADILNSDNHQLSRIEEAQINTSILMAYSLAKALEVELGVLMTVGE